MALAAWRVVKNQGR